MDRHNKIPMIPQTRAATPRPLGVSSAELDGAALGGARGVGVGGATAVAETGQDETGAVEGGGWQGVAQYADLLRPGEENALVLPLGDLE